MVYLNYPINPNSLNKQGNSREVETLLLRTDGNIGNIIQDSY